MARTSGASSPPGPSSNASGMQRAIRNMPAMATSISAFMVAWSGLATLAIQA